MTDNDLERLLGDADITLVTDPDLGTTLPCPDDQPPNDPHSTHGDFPEGVPHIPPWAIMQLQLSRSADDYDLLTMAAYSLGYLSLANRLSGEGYEIVGCVHDVPELSMTICTFVLLVDCEDHPISLEALDRWATFVFGQPTNPDTDPNEPEAV